MNRYFPHQSISASAGSGKTFQLVNRFVALLAAGVDPSRIVALTFSRKAAGEMLDKVLNRLAEAAADPGQAAKLEEALRDAGYQAGPGPMTPRATAPAEGAGQHSTGASLRTVGGLFPTPSPQPPAPTYGAPTPSPQPPAPYLPLLRRLVTSLHRVRISTLDSFFSSVLTAFSFEFGLGGGFAVLDDHAASLARRRTLRQVLRLSASRQSGMADFLEAFKQATFGQEVKSFAGQLDRFVQESHKFFLDAPDSGLWGNPQRIWSGARPLPLPEEQAVAIADRLLAVLDAQGLTPGQHDRLADFLQRAGRFRPGHPLKPLGDLPGKLLGVLDDLIAGKAEIPVDRKRVRFGADECRLALAVISHLIGCEIESALSRTSGLGRILARYEDTWSRLVRGAGQLTFSDIQFLLGQAERDDSLGFPRLSTSPAHEADEVERGNRLFIDYRLDARFDHWLLDEFQDTSTVQWLALKNLLDEVLQDVTGERSLFYVGDVKQAIYGWRGGDSALFHRILEHYNRDPEDPLIRPDSMAVSWRSSKVVLDAVNAVFEGLDRFEELPQASVERWKRVWKEHKAAGTPPAGFVQHVELDKPEKGEDGADERKIRRVAQLLRKVSPSARGLTCAVLVRGNEVGRALVSSLRADGIEAVWAGDFQILDNPACTALLALLRAAEHPGDTQALEFLRMTPFSRLLPWDGSGLAYEATRCAMEDVHGKGFEHFVRRWAQRMDEAVLLDDFLRSRLEQLASAARLFDATGEKRVLEFVDFVEAYTTSDPAQADAVQVMTIHKSKGLEFDMVVLPDLEGNAGIASAGAIDLLVRKDDSVARTPRWVLRCPPKEITAADPTLLAARTRADEDACFEALCLLYVAMTRARRALYMVTVSPGKSSTAVRPSTLVAAGLGDASARPLEDFPYPGTVRFEAGDEAWWGGGGERDTPTAAVAAPPPRGAAAEPMTDLPPKLRPPPLGEAIRGDLAPAHPLRVRLPRATPSGEEQSSTGATSLFLPTGRKAANLGTEVHALFEEVEWWPPDTPTAAFAPPPPGGAAAEPTTDLPPKLRPPPLGEARRGEPGTRASPEALSHFQAALAFPSIRSALSRPSPRARALRERSFEVVLDGRWVTGTFDRLVVDFDEAGAAVSAEIQDYKTSRIQGPDDLARNLDIYRPQMALYRKAAARLLGLPETRIAGRLLFTGSGDVVEV